MAITWKTRLKLEGFDPSFVKDARTPVEALVAIKDHKGAVIGDIKNCTGARCLKRTLDALLVLMYARTAIVVYAPTHIRRYQQGGISGGKKGPQTIAEKQDAGYAVVGQTVKLIPPIGRRRLGQTHDPINPGSRGPNPAPMQSQEHSMAAILRTLG